MTKSCAVRDRVCATRGVSALTKCGGAQLYGAVTVNNTLCLGIFLAIVHLRGQPAQMIAADRNRQARGRSVNGEVEDGKGPTDCWIGVLGLGQRWWWWCGGVRNITQEN